MAGGRPDEPLGSWLEEQLRARGIVLLTGPLDAAAANRAIATLLSLDGEGERTVELHLDCGDGSLEAAFAVADIIGAMRSPVAVRCRGVVGGPAIAVVAAAHHRVAAPHARFRLSQPTAQFSGVPSALAEHSRQQQDLLWRLHALLARRTGRPTEEIAEDTRRGRWLDAQEALVYGLVDEIASPRSDPGAAPPRA